MPQVDCVAGIATERLHQQRDAGLVLHDQVQPDVIQAAPMSATVAAGDVHHVRVRLLDTVIAPIDVEAGAVEMGKGRGQPQALAAVAAMRL